MANTSHRKRSRDISDSSLPTTPIVNIMSSRKDKEEEYERAVAFLRSFHSTPVAALSSPSRSPLGAISENGIGDLINDFSVALHVESSTTTMASSNPVSPRIKKTATSACLLDLDAPSSSSSGGDEKVDDSSLFSTHHQARLDEFSDESCSSSSDYGFGYYGLNGLGNKRHCTSRIR
jgi:hypothetical protein